MQKSFPMQKGFLQKTTGYVKAVDGVNIDVQPGKHLESWVKLLRKDHPGPVHHAHCISPPADGHQCGGRYCARRLRAERQGVSVFRKQAQTIFQDPYSSLNPHDRLADGR